MHRSRLRMFAAGLCIFVFTGSLAGCNGSNSIHTHAANSASQLNCAMLIPGATPYNGVSGVLGLQLPAGSYISKATNTGGGVGQYAIATYTMCFQGSELQIDGPSSSAISKLAAAGWKLNNLFPDPTNFAYLDDCSNTCLNDSGTPNPFTFVGFAQYASYPGDFTAFQLQVATIGAPSCLTDPTIYSGTPKYTIYFDGNTANTGGNATYHFQMPPGTRVSTINGGTAGPISAYFCSDGSQASIYAFLAESMASAGWYNINDLPDSFTAQNVANPGYEIDVTVEFPSNYLLRLSTVTSSTG